MTYTLSYGTGSPGDPWNDMEPMRSVTVALALFRHLARCNPIDAYKLTDSDGRTLVMVVPGTDGDA